MIHFLRHIRRKLLEQNEIQRYLLYAMGEILLVVIGILIALQINNWNETRKDRSFELKMLSEIHKAILFDYQHFKTMADRMVRLSQAVDLMVLYIAEGKPMHDSITNKIYSLNTGISTQYNSGPYSAIKATGIDKISDDTLRNRLINFYDFQFPNFIGQLEHFHRNHIRDIETIVSFQKDPEFNTVNGKPEIFQEFSPDMLKSPDFHRTLRSVSFRSSRIIAEINEFHPEMNEMAEQIQNEMTR